MITQIKKIDYTDKIHPHLLPPPTASFREAKRWGRIEERGNQCNLR